MYALTIDLDEETVVRARPGTTLRQAYAEVARELASLGFERRYDGLFYGGERVNAVGSVLAARQLARALPWFAPSVRDFRLLRIEEQNDLLPAVQAGTT